MKRSDVLGRLQAQIDAGKPIIGGGAGAKFGETCEAEYYRFKSERQEKEIAQLKTKLEATQA